MRGHDRLRLRERFGFNLIVGANICVRAIPEVVVKVGRFLPVLAAARILGPEWFGVYALPHFSVALRWQKWDAVFAGLCVLVNVGGTGLQGDWR